MALNLLVTGGAGYIGSILIPELLNKKFNVTVIDNLMYKQTSLASVISNPKFNLIVGDVRDKDLMKSQIKSADIIIPLAAIVGAPACGKDPVNASSINNIATKWLFSQVNKNQQIIMPTTNSAYGSGDKNNFCDENSPLSPLSLYARDKVDIENQLMQHEFATSFRLATVFGISPRMRLDLLVNNFVYRALIDKYLVLFEGNFKRNYVHIRDVCDAFLFAIENPSVVKGEIFNFGLSSANVSKIELCNIIKKNISDFVYFESTFGKDPDQRNYIVSNKKIESAGITAQVTLDQGIKELIKGLKLFTRFPFSNIN